MLRHKIRYGRVLPVIAAAALVASPLAVPTAASAVAAKNSAFNIGHGNDPSIAVGKDGTAYVAWNHQSASGEPDQLQYCRIPRGKRACTGLITFSVPNGTADHPQLLMPNASTVLIAYYQYAGTSVIPADQTWLLTSTNGGKTFGPAVMVGTHASGGAAAVGPGGTLYTVNDSSAYGTAVQRDNLNGTAIPAEGSQATFTDEYGGSVAVLPGGGVLVAHWDETGGVGTIHVSGFSGTGDPNATASWTTVITQPGEDTQLANGPKGAYLFFAENAPDDPRFGVEKVGTVGVVKPTFVTPKHQSNEQPTFWEDAAGRLNLAYWQDDQMLYRASDLKKWAATEPLKSSGGDNERGATAADGGGFVAYDADDITGLVTLVPIPVRRTITEAVHAGKLIGKVLPAHAHQPVQLQELVGKHWVIKKTINTSAAGGYSFAITTKHSWRAVAPPIEGYAAVTGKTVKH